MLLLLTVIIIFLV